MKSKFEKVFLQKNTSDIRIKRGWLFLISIVIVLIIIPPVKRYTIKDYEKFAKEYGIDYKVVECPKCGIKIPDTIDFCYGCNETLFDADEELIEIFKQVEEIMEESEKSNIVGNIIEMINKVMFYLIIIFIVYMLLILLENVLIFSRRMYLKYRNKGIKELKRENMREKNKIFNEEVMRELEIDMVINKDKYQDILEEEEELIKHEMEVHNISTKEELMKNKEFRKILHGIVLKRAYQRKYDKI